MLSTVLKPGFRLLLVLLLSGCNFGTLSFSERDDHPPGYIAPNVILPKTLVLSAPDTAEVGICSPIDVISQDSNGKAAVVQAAEPVALSITGGSVNLYSDSGCTSPASAVTLAKLTSRATFYIKSMLNAGFTAAASSTKLGFNSKSIGTFRAARQMKFAIAPTNIEGGYCGSEIKVSVQDALGTDFAISANMNITGLPSGAAAYATSACNTTPITQLSFSNVSEKSFFLKTMNIQSLSPTVQAPAALSTLTGQLTANIQSVSAPYDLVLDQPFTSALRLGEFTTTSARVRVKDSAGTVIAPSSPLSVGISASAGAGQFNTTGAGAASAPLNLSVSSTAGANFFLRPMTSGLSPTVIYQASALYRGRTFTAASASSPITIIAAKLAVTMQPATVEGGYCSGEHRVQVRDALDVAFSYTGSISITGLSGSVYSASDCDASGASAISNLTYTSSNTASFYVKTNSVATQTLTFGLPANPPSLAVNLPFTFDTISAPFTLFLDQTPASLKLGEYQVTPVLASRVRVKNSAGAFFNPTTTFTVSASINSGTGELSTSGSGTGTTPINVNIGASPGLFFVKPTTATLSSPQVGYQVSGTYKGRTLSDSSGDIPVIVAAKTVRLYAGSEGAEISSLSVGSGACSPEVTVTLRDGLARRFTPAANTTVTVTFGSGATLSLFHDANCSDPVTAGRPISVAAGAVSDSFFFRETNEAVTSRTLTGSSTGLTAGTFPVTLSRMPFSSDPGFGSNGTQTFNIDGGTDVVSAVTQTVSGKYLVVGRSRTTGGFRASVAMLTAAGKLDGTFNTTGKFVSSGNGTVNCTEARANAVVVASTNSFYIAGKCDSDFLFQKISETGAILQSDRATFAPATAEATAVALSSGGSLYAAGVAVDATLGNLFAIARYNSAGIMQGTVEIPLGSIGTLVDVKGLTVQRVGAVDKLVVLATIKNAANDNDMALCRMVDAPTPGLDTTFNTTGCQLFDNGAKSDSASALLLGSSGKLIAVGTTAAADASVSGFLMAQTDANGVVDASFGSGAAHLATHFSGKIEATAAAMFTSATGQILVAGRRLNSATDANWYAARFTSAGALDGAPAPSSKSFPNLLTDASAELVGGVFIGADNKPVIAGTVGTDQSALQVLH